jgi:hypothetical protein
MPMDPLAVVHGLLLQSCGPWGPLAVLWSMGPLAVLWSMDPLAVLWSMDPLFSSLVVVHESINSPVVRGSL